MKKIGAAPVLRAVAFVFFLTSRVYCAQLSSDIKFKSLEDFYGGLNTQASVGKVSDNEATNLQNILIDEKPGSLVKRKGYIISGSTPTLSKINFLFIYYKDNGSKEYLVADSSRVFSTKDFNSFTVVRNTLTTTSNLEAAQGRGKVWFTNGSDPVFNWDGTSIAVLDGTGNTPYVPACKFITYYQERFFLFNSTADPASLYYSALTSTDAQIIVPDDYRAFPVTNVLKVGSGDGQSGTGEIVDRGQLFLHKDKSIYTLFGTDEFSYFPRITNAQVGTVSNDSIVILDNYQYFLAKDGVYQFDGRDAVRISDKITPDIRAIINNKSKIVSNTWQTQSDWNRGVIYGATTSLNNLILSSGLVVFGFNRSGCFGFQDLTAGTSVQGIVNFDSNLYSASSNSDYFIRRIKLGDGNGAGNPCGSSGVDPSLMLLSYMNLNTLTRATVTATCASDENNCKFFNFDVSISTDPQKVKFTGSEVNGSSMVISLLNQNAGTVKIGQPFVAGASQLQGEIDLVPNTTGHFTSDVTTITNTVTFWDKFNSLNVSNGGLINYFIRTATSSVNITTVSYVSISPGVVINALTANNYFQFTSSLIASNQPQNTTLLTVPSISNVVVSHNEGGGSDTRAIGVKWKGRYLLSVSTVSDGSVSTMYVKSLISNSNPNAWMKMIGFNIKSMINDLDDTLYAGGASTGSILRLDYGTNDNGIAIDAFLETAETGLGSKYFEDWIREIYLDNDPQAGTVKFGISVNGNPFSFETFSLNSGSRIYTSIKDSILGIYGKSFKFRIENDQLDQPLVFNGMTIAYQEKESH